ncbi:MAG: hypothetical protein VKL59_22110 [Nostocaceae cyanobacterium]|nr:hypothetical protein [Nostocaceae cyanobacterium]
MPEIIWTSYLRYRVTQRGFDLNLIENILRFSSERYYDVDAIVTRNPQDFPITTPRIITPNQLILELNQ